MPNWASLSSAGWEEAFETGEIADLRASLVRRLAKLGLHEDQEDAELRGQIAMLDRLKDLPRQLAEEKHDART